MFPSGLFFANILAPCAKLVQPSVKNAVRVFAQGKEALSDLHNRLREVSMKRSSATTLALLALMAAPASADTLREALISTYQANPTITACGIGRLDRSSRGGFRSPMMLVGIGGISPRGGLSGVIGGSGIGKGMPVC